MNRLPFIPATSVSQIYDQVMFLLVYCCVMAKVIEKGSCSVVPCLALPLLLSSK